MMAPAMLSAPAEVKFAQELIDDGYVVEAVCTTCGEVYNPAAADELDHINTETGQPCGPGIVNGGWKS